MDLIKEHWNKIVGLGFMALAFFVRMESGSDSFMQVGFFTFLKSFKEKPSLQYEVSMGIYMMNRDVLNFVPNNTSYGFDQLMLDLMAADRRPAVRAFDGYWLDIGRPDDYMRAIDEFDSLKHRFLYG